MSTSQIKFLHPPLIESVMAVQFEPLESMHVTDYGGFQQILGPSFTSVEDHPRMSLPIESPNRFPAPSWRVVQTVQLPRAWFLGESGESGQEVVQLQPDLLIYNWRKKGLSKQDYPSYDLNKVRFETIRSEFARYVSQKLPDC